VAPFKKARNKCGTICKDIDQMRLCADALIRYQLLKFCMNTRLSFLSRNVIPDNMTTDCDDRANIGPAHVDNKIVQEVLRAATGDTLKHAPQLVQKQWCKLRVQSPHHEGCVNADSSVRSSSFLFCNQQVRRISRKSPSWRRMAARRTSAYRSRHVV